jgi:uncharacterized membrane protein YphA (DoxX/SURF4 family)
MRSLLTIFIASVWLINGLFLKLLNFAPRHKEIVGSILGEENALFLTKMIGLGEVFLAVLIILGFRSRLMAIIQIILVVVMNTLEIIIVPDLLLFGRLNGVIALGFIMLIIYTEFSLNKKGRKQDYRFSS